MTCSASPTRPHPTTTGGWLRRWRERAGLTQAQAAEQIGVIQSTISFWENERNSVPLDELRRLVALYGVPVEEAGLRVIAPAQALTAPDQVAA
jgi:transcriptional regulator with XRE-family HTH domain